MAKSHTTMLPVAVFDISSSSVAGAHALVPKGSLSKETKVSFLASTRTLSEPREDLNIERFVADTVAGLEATITTLKKADAHKPDYIQILLASPWFVSQSRTITYSKTTPFTCSQKLIDSLIEKEIAYVMEHDMEKFGTMGRDGVIIEKQISLIKLNGYTTTKPFGKKAQSLELSLVVTVSPKTIVERFTTCFKKAYGNATLRFTTSPYATFIVVRDFLGTPSELMIVDIGEEITDIACIKDELFLYEHSFPVGSYQLYRTLVANDHSTMVEARALVDSFHLGKLSAAMTSSTQKALEDFGALWIRSFQEILNTGKDSLRLPGLSYIICDQRFNEFFSETIKNDPFFTHTIAATEYQATTVTPELLAPHVSSIDLEKVDETLIVGALFTSRVL